MGFRRVAALSMARLLVGVGCSDDPAGPLGSLPTLESLQNRLPPGIHPVLVFPSAAEGSTDLTARLHFVRVGESRDVQAFQGWVQVDPGVVSVQSARVVGPAPVAVRVVGHTVHFAGATPDGLGDAAFLEVTLRTSSRIENGDVTLSVEELVGGVAPASFTDLADAVPDGTVHLVRGGS